MTQWVRQQGFESVNPSSNPSFYLYFLTLIMRRKIVITHSPFMQENFRYQNLSETERLPYEVFRYTRVEKTWLPCYDFAMVIRWPWRNMAMVMPWLRHGGHVSWHGVHGSWHDQGMIATFSMIHIKILVWSSCSQFFFEKMDFFVKVFPNNCCHLPLNVTNDWL